MPKLDALKAEIWSDGKPLEEYATQRLRNTRTISTWIESTTDKPFAILIQPDIPWDYAEADGLTSQGVEEWGRSQQHHQRYSLIADTYLDGRKNPERRSVIYLDSNHPDAAKGCKLWVKHRWAMLANGELKQYRWAFKEREVEAFFAGLDLDGATVEPEDAEDALSKALESTDLRRGESRSPTSESKLGQIVVNVYRAILSTSYVDTAYSSYSRDGGDEDMNMNGVDKDITHLVGSVASELTVRDQPRVVDLTWYKPELGPYATFYFRYRPRNQLAKMGLKGYPHQLTAPQRKTRQLNALLPTLTPLSMTERKKKLDKRKADEATESYEDRVIKQAFRPYVAPEPRDPQSYRSSRKSKKTQDSVGYKSGDKTGEHSEKWTQGRRSKGKVTTVNGSGENPVPSGLRRSERLHTKASQNPATPRKCATPLNAKTGGGNTSSVHVPADHHDYRDDERDSEMEEDAANAIESEEPDEAGDVEEDFAPNREEEGGAHCQIREGIEGILRKKRGYDSFGKDAAASNAQELGIAITPEDGISDDRSDSGRNRAAETKARTTESEGKCAE